MVNDALRYLLAFLAALLVCQITCAEELFGTIDAISGNASVTDKSGVSSDISKGQKIYQGQTINTSPESETHLVTVDGGIIALRPDTAFRVDEYKAEGDSNDKIYMSLLKGAMRSITGWIGKYNPLAYRITTASATIGIRGTDHETTVIDNADGDEPGTYDKVNEGATSLKTPKGETEVSPGKFAFASKGGAVAPVILTKQPSFWAKRKLKIENRIQKRKEFLRDHMEERRNKRIEAKHNEAERKEIKRKQTVRKAEAKRNDEKRNKKKRHD